MATHGWLADADRVFQVFSNLIGNAIKFTPAGGTVTLDATSTEGWVRFAVRDTGPGIVAGELANIFDRYWQARRVTERGRRPRAVHRQGHRRGARRADLGRERARRPARRSTSRCHLAAVDRPRARTCGVYAAVNATATTVSPSHGVASSWRASR